MFPSKVIRQLDFVPNSYLCGFNNSQSLSPWRSLRYVIRRIIYCLDTDGYFDIYLLPFLCLQEKKIKKQQDIF